MSPWTMAALVFVGLGAGVMGMAVVRALGLLAMLDAETGKQRWQALTGLMAFFLVGYALTAVLLIIDRPELLVLMVGLVFLGGAAFVLMVVGSGAHTVGLLRAREEDLRRKGEEASQTAGQLSAILANLADGLVAVDRGAAVELANPAIRKMLELDGEPVGAPIVKVLPPELCQMLELCHASDDAVTTEFTLPGGGTGLAVASAIRRDASGESPGCVMLVRDVTLAKEVDRMKSDFTAVVSHELRTPLTSVLGFAKLISNKLERQVFPKVADDDARGQKAVAQVRSNLEIVLAEGQRLTALINDVLDISKMESGQVEWNMRPLRVREVCERAIAATASLFPEERPVAISLEVEDALGDILGSEDRLIQVLINLISNASKFTDTGVVEVTARALGEREVELAVRDTGTGIRPADQETVFQRFKQVGDPMTDRPKGTGLGLPICKEIVTHHEGRIWVESTLGEGSRFAFTIPLVEAGVGLPVDPRDLQNLIQQLRVKVADIPAVSGSADILVVDDDPALREMLTQQLTEHGYTVRQAEDGVQAMREARDKRPDLIILDVMMPGLSGFDVVSMLRADDDVDDVPIMILSIVEDADRGYRLGVDRYLNKPVDHDVLLREIEALIRRQSPHRVLVVSDAKANVPTLVQMLQASGLEVVGHCDRAQAVARALEVRPDVVLVDAPGSEFEALAGQLHRAPELADVNVMWLLDAARKAG